MSSAELKVQGNALFSAKNFQEADKKYTKAIQAGDEAADPKGLAVVYANRAACRLPLKRYMDAASDARKATRLDPTYAKGFARLATANAALGDYPESKEDWKRALAALPKSNLTPAQLLQKEQYQVELKAVTSSITKLQNQVIPISLPGGREPWVLAAEKLPALRIQRPVGGHHIYSSAWVIHGAYEEFMNGVNKMNQLRADGGMLGAVVDISNGVMRDSRVMRMTDPQFINKFNKQVFFEIQRYRPWTQDGPEVVIREALARQRSEGWNSVRPAVSMTIRGWIMKAFMEADLRHTYDVAIELYKCCLDVLRSLRESWIAIPLEDRGVVFEESFVFGIQHLYINAIMHSYDSNPSPKVLEELDKESDLLIREVDQALSHPRAQQPVENPGQVSSFYMYPRGTAYATKGFSCVKKSIVNPNDAKELCREAALAYIKAAACFPEDDEWRPWFLSTALKNMSPSQSFSLRETLAVMERIRVTAPKAKEIWEYSPFSAGGVWDTYKVIARQEQKLRDRIASGTLSMDAIYSN
ncbi:hypothetical protein C8R44DRAFT_383893 [Mycena epipterygia]|nr:hypothetical protein C8R44DRAFT_383893 [Mycena epipterygia]